VAFRKLTLAIGRDGQCMDSAARSLKSKPISGPCQALVKGFEHFELLKLRPSGWCYPGPEQVIPGPEGRFYGSWHSVPDRLSRIFYVALAIFLLRLEGHWLKDLFTQ
jgi:hypothetical protein